MLPAGRRLLEGAHACLIQAFELPQARAYPEAFAAAAQLLCTALLAAHPSLLMVLLEPDAPDVYQPQGNYGRGGKVGQAAAEGVWAEQGAPQARQDSPAASCNGSAMRKIHIGYCFNAEHLQADVRWQQKAVSSGSLLSMAWERRTEWQRCA